MRQKVADLEARLEGRRSESWHGPMKSSSSVSRSPADVVESGTMGGSTERNHGSSFAAFFLDAEVFQESNMRIPKLNIPVPAEVASTVGVSILDIQDVVDRYFANVHSWLPCVSKKRMQLALSNPSVELTLDLALLLLAMKLIIQIPRGGSESVRSPLYALAKSYFPMVESHGVLSLQVLQADLLIAAYEIGHGIYPAAYLTTGHCARLGHALGLNDRQNTPQLLKRKPGAWAELEEMKRAWWAVMLLDRYVSPRPPRMPSLVPPFPQLTQH